MALLQLLLRFSATDHGDCDFGEESLEKVTDLGHLFSRTWVFRQLALSSFW
jgi:hypothetical protein